jgi:hypothetical protein
MPCTLLLDPIVMPHIILVYSLLLTSGVGGLLVYRWWLNRQAARPRPPRPR